MTQSLNVLVIIAEEPWDEEELFRQIHGKTAVVLKYLPTQVFGSPEPIDVQLVKFRESLERELPQRPHIVYSRVCADRLDFWPELGRLEKLLRGFGWQRFTTPAGVKSSAIPQ